MAFGYDRSRLQDSGEVLLSAVFRVSAGDPAALRATARQSLAFRKRTQPLDTPSAGCIFQNPQPGATRCRTASRGRPARSSIARAEGRGDRRRARVADARQLHRERGAATRADITR
jgi:UDP-N-acetylenolpyruvoylglucosamine reductase